MKAAAWKGLVFGLLLLGCSAQAEYLYSQEYTEAARAVLARRYTDARTLAEAMLLENADSFEGHAVLGQAHLWGQEDLGLAEWHLTQARELIEDEFSDLKSEDAPRSLHQQVLKGLRQVAFLSERYEDALALLDRYDALYDPLPAPRAWLLLKLQRFEQARQVVKAAQARMSETDPGQVALWDTLAQIAYEEGNLSEATQLYERACELELDTAEEPDPVYWTNLGEAYRDQGDFSKAQESFESALEWPHPGSYAEPNKRLAYLHAAAGNFEQAFTYLEAAIGWRAELWPQVAAHTRASHLTGVGEVFLAYGDTLRARRALERALLYPHRQAMNSGSTEALLAKRYLLYAGALHLEAERALESAVTATGWSRWSLRRQAVTSNILAAWARSHASVVLARGPGLAKAMRPYGPGAMQAPWLLSELANALGEPVIEKVLNDSEQPAWQDYAERLAQPSLADWESLVKAQMLARRGRWAEALKLDPAVTRRLGLSIGLKVEGSEEVESLAHSSPRFHQGKALTLKVDSQNAATLVDGKGEVLLNLAAQSSPAMLVEELHQALFERTTSWSSSRLDGLAREPSPGRMVSRRLAEFLDATDTPEP